MAQEYQQLQEFVILGEPNLELVSSDDVTFKAHADTLRKYFGILDTAMQITEEREQADQEKDKKKCLTLRLDLPSKLIDELLAISYKDDSDETIHLWPQGQPLVKALAYMDATPLYLTRFQEFGLLWLHLERIGNLGGDAAMCLSDSMCYVIKMNNNVATLQSIYDGIPNDLIKLVDVSTFHRELTTKLGDMLLAYSYAGLSDVTEQILNFMNRHMRKLSSFRKFWRRLDKQQRKLVQPLVPRSEMIKVLSDEVLDSLRGRLKRKLLTQAVLGDKDP